MDDFFDPSPSSRNTAGYSWIMRSPSTLFTSVKPPLSGEVFASTGCWRVSGKVRLFSMGGSWRKPNVHKKELPSWPQCQAACQPPADFCGRQQENVPIASSDHHDIRQSDKNSDKSSGILTGNLPDLLASLLAFYRAIFLTFFPTVYLTFCLAIFLTFYVAF